MEYERVTHSTVIEFSVPPTPVGLREAADLMEKYNMPLDMIFDSGRVFHGRRLKFRLEAPAAPAESEV